MPMIKLLLAFLLSVLAFTLPAQDIKTFKVKRETDTLIYPCLFIGTYNLKSVTQKGTLLPYNCYKESKFSLDNRYLDSTFVKRSDSLAWIDWYQLKNGQCLKCDHHVAIWKVRLNKQGNTLLVRRTQPVLKKGLVDVNDPDHLLFKVIKCSCSELILEDIPITPNHKRYYFSRKPETPTQRLD